ncbi:hypothetical protein [Paenibacillus borealis]|uniref:Butirosin biosynthesis protein H N-terminal domain-containing protein n=1 Tax=Paenibacillus borealis TaxID=160799 RepID=A0A089L851_PAEBO|nr:hypothetical protein [Paenibacillus borealis]AIQ56962.1 hypothetical protein PBOR_08480 [Paenibacillus borealis]
MSRKVLPIKKPLVKCYLYDACPLSILANTEDYLEWFYSNYIQLFCSKNILEDGYLFLEFYGKNQAFTSPWLQNQHLSGYALVKTQQDIIKFIIDNIDLGYYFYGHLDDFYVPFRMGYRTFHYLHDLMIYGYDEEENVFLVMAYDKNALFGHFEISFDTFKQGFSLDYSMTTNKPYWYDWVYLFKFNNHGQYNFDLKLVEELLHDYLFGINTSEKHRASSNPWPNENKAFGMEVYQYLKMYFMHLLNRKIEFDIRITSILVEHKRSMLGRIKYIHEKGYLQGLEPLYERYVEVEKTFITFQGLMIKYRVTGKRACIDKIINSLDDIAQKEKMILSELLKKIEQNNALRKWKEIVQ